MQTREIPKKNYVLFGVMTVAVVFAVLYAANWYSMTKEYFLNYSSMNSVLMNVDESTLANYVNEKSELVIYVSDSKDASIKNFEKKFKKLVINNDIKNSIVYLDMSKVESTKFLENFDNRFFSDELKKTNANIKNVPNLIYFEDGKAVDILYSNNETINIDDVKSFLIECEVIELD